MKFAGIQKVTLLDYPEHIACTLFTRGCSFRCPFCHNKELIEMNPMGDVSDIDEEEIIEFLKTRIGKLEGVCITGGEPLLHDEIFSFVKKVKELGFKIKIDTNGRMPEKIQKLIDEKNVDMFAMDIKSSFDTYDLLSGKKVDIEKIKQAIKILIDNGNNNKIDYEFRTTCVKNYHKLDDFEKIPLMIKGAKKYFLQNFRCVEGVTPEGMEGFSKTELVEIQKLVINTGLIEKVEIRGVD